MCITAFILNENRRFRFVLVGNRDEFVTRPTAPIRQEEDIVAARDEIGHGYQTALNVKNGILASLTNIRAQPHGTGHRSRGLLVEDAAYQRPIDDIAREVYAGFNLITADLKKGVVEYRTNHVDWKGPDVMRIKRGAHCMSNTYLDDASWPKVFRLKERLVDTFQALVQKGSDVSAEEVLEAVAEPLCDTPEEGDCEMYANAWATATDDLNVFRTRFQTVVLCEALKPEDDDSPIRVHL
eukprot:gene11586-17848_t